MSDLLGSPVVEVAIGLAFVYFLFSLIASSINEVIASVFALRASSLEQGLRRMLEGSGTEKVDGGNEGDENQDGEDPVGETIDAVGQLANHALIKGLIKNPAGVTDRLKPWSRGFPSYLHDRTFALALLDTIAPPQPGNDGPDSRNVLERLEQNLNDPATDAGKLPEQAKQALRALLRDAEGSIARLRKSIETWFDDTMDRVSGWYKRRATMILLVIAFVVSAGFNLDSWQLANTLWTDDGVRSAVVAKAERATSQKTVTDAAKVANEKLDVPVGWASADAKDAGGQSDPRAWPGTDVEAWGPKLLGLLITTLALTLGAPFWFDLLNRLVKLRQTGTGAREPAAPA